MLGAARPGAAIERPGGEHQGPFPASDGGIEHNAALLPGLVSRADIAAFPVDCVSHDAVAAVKRACRQLGKRYIPLRTSSLACLLSGLSEMQPVPAAVFLAVAIVDAGLSQGPVCGQLRARCKPHG